MWNSLYLAIAAVFLVQGETSGQLAVGIPEPVTTVMASTTTALSSSQAISNVWLIPILVISAVLVFAARKRLKTFSR